MPCTDGPSPKHSTDAQLSRIKDALDALAQFPSVRHTCWMAFSELVRFEFNWCNWEYVPPTGGAK